MTALRAPDVAELLALAALWGASFLFMRLGAADFGPVALAFVRVAGASLLLLPLLALRRQFGDLRAHWRPIALVGITNSALPFLLYSYAALSISSGLAAIFNAASPLFAAVIAWLWLRDRLTPWRIVGLLIGFAGVVGLAWHNASFKAGGSGWAVAACLLATLFYGASANFTRRHLANVAPLAVAAGSQLSATLCLALPAAVWWPQQNVPGAAWASAAALAVLCTGVAYILFFRLIARVGSANAISVTFLIPVFAVVWGGIFLGEPLTAAMGLGCAVIVLGTGLATGLVKPAWKNAHPRG